LGGARAGGSDEDDVCTEWWDMVGLDSVVCHDGDEYRNDSAVPHGSGAAEYAGVALLLREGTAVATATGRCRVGTGKGRAARAGDDKAYPVPCTTAVVAGVGAAATATGACTGRVVAGSGREWHGMVIPEGNVVVAVFP
jgi:hypothetical protein